MKRRHRDGARGRSESRTAPPPGPPSGSAKGGVAEAGAGPRSPYRPPRLRAHGTLADLTGAAEGTVNDGAGGFFAFSGAAG